MNLMKPFVYIMIEQSKAIQDLCLIEVHPVKIKDFCEYFNYSLSFEINCCNKWTFL